MTPRGTMPGPSRSSSAPWPSASRRWEKSIPRRGSCERTMRACCAGWGGSEVAVLAEGKRALWKRPVRSGGDEDGYLVDDGEQEGAGPGEGGEVLEGGGTGRPGARGGGGEDDASAPAPGSVPADFLDMARHNYREQADLRRHAGRVSLQDADKQHPASHADQLLASP